jgi:hypothetical protein
MRKEGRARMFFDESQGGDAGLSIERQRSQSVPLVTKFLQITRGTDRAGPRRPHARSIRILTAIDIRSWGFPQAARQFSLYGLRPYRSNDDRLPSPRPLEHPVSEFLLIVPGPEGAPRRAALAASNPAAILEDLRASLEELDAIGASLAAAHLALAIDRLRIQFNLAEDSSGTD